MTERSTHTEHTAKERTHVPLVTSAKHVSTGELQLFRMLIFLAFISRPANRPAFLPDARIILNQGDVPLLCMD